MKQQRRPGKLVPEGHLTLAQLSTTVSGQTELTKKDVADARLLLETTYKYGQGAGTEKVSTLESLPAPVIIFASGFPEYIYVSGQPLSSTAIVRGQPRATVDVHESQSA